MTKSASTIGTRIALQIELAVTADQPDRELRIRQEERATLEGLTRAEVDVARAGRSFDVRAAAAIELAIASRSTDPATIGAAVARAERAGFDADARSEIHALAHRFKPEC